ncbi:hypothetical protein [Flavobacterium collinsii]|uniref:Uncharacterized protein n=1 Tax=Flavobacterium collinsii TaxID=1114861 RepID=A0A9W4XFF3_9FLAO|nr:hypothetical protein [Flavobacterium collinsii]CAI2768164.1 conserved protein of unknown function [Flavobacterium collinsii]
MENSKYSEEFKYFMSSDINYERNKDYWKKNIIDLSNHCIEDWVSNSFGNGTEIKDGNPLFSCRFSSDKALRIIQDVRNPYSPVFASWISNYEIEDNSIEELVIALQPYKDTYSNSKLLIQNYLKGNYKLLQKRLNIKYNKKTNNNRIHHILKFLENTELPSNSWNIKSQEIISNQINHNLFKKINNLNQNLYFYQSTFEDKTLKNSFNSFLKSMEKLNNIITLKYSYDLDKGFRSDAYRKDIVKTFSNLNNYVKNYNSTVDDLEEKYKELKKQFEEHSH